MECKPIRTEGDYEAAMARIQELWGIHEDSPDADELEILLALTGVYEKKRHNLPAPDPTSWLEYRMDQMGLTADQIRRYLECRRRLPEIMSHETHLSLDIIEGLGDLPGEQMETP